MTDGVQLILIRFKGPLHGGVAVRDLPRARDEATVVLKFTTIQIYDHHTNANSPIRSGVCHVSH